LSAEPAAALSRRLAELGVAVDHKGYVERADDAMLPTFPATLKGAIRAALSGKGGSELLERQGARPKFHAAYSSACLAANVFGPWLARPGPVPFGGQSFAGEMYLEAECPTGLRGNPPTLDFLVAGSGVLAVESKCTETFGGHRADFEPAYEVVMDTIGDSTWQAEYRRLTEDPRRYRFLDAAQLIKHYLGLLRRFGDRPVTLAYLYWQPSNANEVGACLVHEAEVAEFGGRLKDPRVRFVPMSYAGLWEDWTNADRPGWLRDHVSALLQRYNVLV
jgi:hypothetical protein